MLEVHVGTSYDKASLKHCLVNQGQEYYVPLTGPEADVKVAVRIQNYDGANRSDKYFRNEGTAGVSIQFQITFHRDVNGDDLIWGNDFDEPIKDMLPYGVSIGVKILKWIDPTVDGDVYAAKPYLYGKALGSIKKISNAPDDVDSWHYLKTGVNLDGTTRESSDFANPQERAKITFKKDHTYAFDFYTPYLSLGRDLAIQLPGFSLDVQKYCHRQPLRYVLKERDGPVLLAICFTPGTPEPGITNKN